MSLERFKQAQEDPHVGFATALREMQAGRKTSHWIWYVFPQLASLGRSATARYYGIADLAEARAYLDDPELFDRLLSVTETAAEQLKRGISVTALMGGDTDSLKLMSSMTLFQHAAETLAGERSDPRFPKLAVACASVLKSAGSQGFGRCEHTDAACRR